MSQIRHAAVSLLNHKNAAGASLDSRRNDSHREYGEVLRETDVMAIPDVHGDIQALRNSLHSMGLIDTAGHWIGGKNVAVFLGDYIDRGDTNLAVLDYILKLRSEAEAAGGKIELLLGNHEAFLIGAMVDKYKYREYWLMPNNGGAKIFEEIQKKFQLNGDEEVWKKMRELFSEGGEYFEYIQSMKLLSQVDDVLYVHGGIDEKWAEIFAKEGVEAVNERWKKAYTDLMRGLGRGFEEINNSQSPLGLRYNSQIKTMPETTVSRIAGLLRQRGINAVVVGHDIMPFGPQMHKDFEKHGIKLIATDVEMSSGYNGIGSGQGGVKIEKQGDIQGWFAGGSTYLHREAPPVSKAA